MQDGTFTPPGYPEGTRPARGRVFDSDCPTRKLLDRIGDKWSVLILLVLGDEDTRFNDLKRQIGGISQKMLSQTLQSLKRDGLITRAVEPTTPVTVTYSITPLGRELLAALRFMIDWAEVRLPDVEKAQRLHDAALATD
ncbi:MULTISPECIES: helix-turn-helix domain-containing protein [unclassified Devosia]|uniref:winged helix-turn-helix transcriptional regulator n=1 Tax=unclassified Devosia TaxID=196773 RepID=UPI00145D7D3B|nr:MULTISPECIES: helix-turn-helix domain-containing protein [unclassified Devosia]MBJ6987627.1 helix-turn-helix transcriptional regulator [Devosia sp. MC521]QMW62313.1 helix-turn-helix transcriptional regulator [Devosia sp. MC521]